MALLVGPRGHGKRSLLTQCLHDLKEEYINVRYRIVKLNGLMNNGNDGAAMGEAAAQLTTTVSAPGMRSNSGDSNYNKSDNDGDDAEVCAWSPIAVVPNSDGGKSNRKSKRKRHPDEDELSAIGRSLGADYDNNAELKEHTDHYRSMNMKGMQTTLQSRHHSSNHMNTILVHDSLRRAKVDEIPVIFILNEIDSFADQKGLRQMLLYHLLDKIGADDTYFIVIGITTRQTVTQMFEKRVRSRSISSQVIIHFPRYTFDALTSIMLQKFDQRDSDANLQLSNGGDRKCVYHQQLSALLRNNEQVRQAFSRQLALGKDVRWFCRVLSTALVLLDDDDPKETSLDKTIVDSLFANGADMSRFVDDSGEDGRRGFLHPDPRMQELLNLSGSQVAVLLSVKRIMSRSALVSGDDVRGDENILTFDKIYREYETFSMRQSLGVDKYEKPLFFRAFVQLIECEMLKLQRDHSGPRASILEYDYNSNDIFNNAMMQHVPVHLPYELQMEIHSALYDRRLDSSTALRDWGLRSN